MIAASQLSEARPGDRIRAAYNALVREVRRWRFLAGDGVRVVETPVGTVIVRVPEPAVFEHPWRTQLAGDSAVLVGPGRLNTQIVWLGGRPIDNLDKDGKPLGGQQPALPIDASDPADQWVVLRARVDKDWKPLPPERQTVETTRDVTWLGGFSTARPLDDGEGWQGDFPLALVRGGRVWQIAHFHLRSRATGNSTGGKFWFFV